MSNPIAGGRADGDKLSCPPSQSSFPISSDACRSPGSSQGAPLFPPPSIPSLPIPLRTQRRRRLLPFFLQRPNICSGDAVFSFLRQEGEHVPASFPIQSTAIKDSTERPQNLEVVIPTSVSAAHGFQVAVEFKPVEHPIEPLDHDQPVRCPLPEPSILNDGRIWKERMTSVSARMRTERPVVNEGSQLASEAEVPTAKPPRPTARRAILPSVSAPEGNFINLLDEFNASKEQNAGNSNLMQQ